MKHLTGLALLLLGGAAVAAEPAPTAPRTTEKAEKPVCKTVPQLGSRLARKKVCQTGPDSTEQRKSARDGLDDVRMR